MNNRQASGGRAEGRTDGWRGGELVDGCAGKREEGSSAVGDLISSFLPFQTKTNAKQ